MNSDKRQLLVAKMCAAYNENIKCYSQETCMDAALAIAERLLHADDTTETERHIAFVRYAPATNHDAMLDKIVQWLRYDVPKSLRSQITSDLCHKLALRLSFLGE